MATKEEVRKLAALARIRVGDEELEKFTSEFDAILEYIGQLEKLNVPPASSSQPPALRNVMRADGEPHAPSEYTEKLVAQFPASPSFAEATEGKEKNYLVVKQIIQYDGAE